VRAAWREALGSLTEVEVATIYAALDVVVETVDFEPLSVAFERLDSAGVNPVAITLSPRYHAQLSRLRSSAKAGMTPPARETQASAPRTAADLVGEPGGTLLLRLAATRTTQEAFAVEARDAQAARQVEADGYLTQVGVGMYRLTADGARVLIDLVDAIKATYP
jgi:hypothetical protein